MKRFMIWLIKLYRKILSPLKPPCCRFTPTCSQYAIEAFEKRGFFVGFGLTVWRILRCNPFSKGGYDPVPEKRGAKGRKNAETAGNSLSDLPTNATRECPNDKSAADSVSAEKTQENDNNGGEKLAPQNAVADRMRAPDQN